MNKQVLLIIALLSLSMSGLAQEKYSGGLIFDDKVYENIPLEERYIQDSYTAKLKPKVSLKAYTPTPQNQGSYNNCVAWSTAYAARTIIEARKRNCTDRRIIDKNAFSPGFIHKMISTENSCYEPTSIDEALRVMKSKGVAKLSSLNTICPDYIPRDLYREASRYRIQQYNRLFYLKADKRLKVSTVKMGLAEGQAVIIGMRCPPSFEKADGKIVWNPAESPNTRNYFGHAMCVVGYDDTKYGGAFEIMNSWGSKWGKQGFIWVRYKDFANFAKYAYVINVDRVPYTR